MKMTAPASPIPERTLVLVGMMGAGKTVIGRQLAARLGLPFVDSDAEIEAAAGMTIAQFFERYGEPAFREGEQRVLARLLAGPRCVLSTGGGAFINEETRALIKAGAVSVWIKADLETLVRRTEHRDDRPLLLGGDLRQRLADLLAQREPVYAQADMVLISDDRPLDDTVEQLLEALRDTMKQVRV